MCNCNKNDLKSSDTETVPDFTLTGFAPKQLQQASVLQDMPEEVLALDFKACVQAYIRNGKICFKLPFFGEQCVGLPINIPLPDTSELKACAATCGSFVPTGAKVSLYAGSVHLFTYSIGFC